MNNTLYQKGRSQQPARRKNGGSGRGPRNAREIEVGAPTVCLNTCFEAYCRIEKTTVPGVARGTPHGVPGAGEFYLGERQAPPEGPPNVSGNIRNLYGDPKRSPGAGRRLPRKWLESASRWPHDRQDGFKANREREILLRGRSGVQVLSPDASYFVAELLSNTLYQKPSDICHTTIL